MGKFFTWHFWFASGPGQLMPIYRNGLAVFIFVLLAVAIAAGSMKKKQNKILGKFWGQIKVFALTNAFLGAMLLFFDYELAPFLSSRFWYPLWFLSMTVWVYFIIKALKGLKKRRAEQEKMAEFKKYIP